MADWLIASRTRRRETLKGKKIAMTWAYSPSYGKPLSVPQGLIGLFTRLQALFANPEIEVMDDVIEVAKRQSAESGGNSRYQRHGEASRRGHRVPEGWGRLGDESARSSTATATPTHQSLERSCSSRTRAQDWECTEELMASTRTARRLPALPARRHHGRKLRSGEVAASVFDRYRGPALQAGFLQAVHHRRMIFLAKVKDPAACSRRWKKGLKAEGSGE
jgi:ornithine carbamoyltransferase